VQVIGDARPSVRGAGPAEEGGRVESPREPVSSAVPRNRSGAVVSGRSVGAERVGTAVDAGALGSVEPPEGACEFQSLS
jgi:hypothetical protein